MKYIFDYTVIDCAKADLSERFALHQISLEDANNGTPPAGTLAVADGLTINGVTMLADEMSARHAVESKAPPGGGAIAVRFAQPDPVTGAVLDGRGERRMVWLIGANCAAGLG